MKKSTYLALAVATLAFFACTSKPTESEQQADQQVDQTIQVEQAPAAEPALVVEEPAVEPAPEEPAAAPEQPAPAIPSNKFAIDRSDGNFVAFVNEIVTADAEGCIDVAFVFDKIEESKVRLIVDIETVEGSKVGVFPIGVEPGGTKGHVAVCASMGGVFSKITPGEQYKLSFRRAILQ